MNARISRSCPGPVAAAVLAAALFALLPAAVLAQTTYTWNQTASASWAISTNWTPKRTTPATNDILVINGVTTPAPTITNLPTQTIGRLRILSNAQVTLTALSSGQTLTISGATSPAFEMQAGTALSLINSQLITIALSGSSTSSISGAIGFDGGAHQLTAANASQLTFQSGGSFTTNTLFSGNAFGSTGTANAVVFASGSIYRHNAGSDPFGLAAPSSRVVFQPGSTAILRTATGFQSSGRTYANLTLQNNAAVTGSGTGNFQLQTLNVEAGSSFTHTGSGTASVTVTGDIQSAGSGNLALTAGSGGIVFAGGVTQTVGGGGGTGTITFGSSATVNAGTTLALSRALTFTAGSLTVNGNLTRNAGGSIAPAPTYGSTATLTYAAPATVGNEWGTGTSVGLGVPRNVTVAAAGTVSMPVTDRSVPGDLTISSGTLAMNAGGGTLSVGGNWTSSGTFTPAGRTVVINGTATQTLSRSGGETLFALQVNKSAGNLVLASSPATDLTLTGNSGNVLVLTNGAIVTGSQTVILAAAGTVTRTNGFVAGNLRKTVPTGSPTVSFEIGSGATYAPASVVFASVTNGGTLTASTTAGEHPNVATSSIDATKSVNRWWTVTNALVAFSTYDIVVNFPAGDADAGVVPSNFAMQKYNAPNWSFGTPGTMSATSAQATDLTSFSDFAVGELRTVTVTATAGPNGSIAPSGAVIVPYNTSPVFNINPNSGYQVQNVLVDGVSVGAVSSHTFNNVTANHTISATFVLGAYTLSITTIGSGSVARNPNQATYLFGTNVSMTATPDFGYQFSGWTGDVTSSLNPISIMMDGNKTVTATFTRVVLGYERVPFVAAYTPISTAGGAGTALVTADDSTSTIPLPFNFVFSGIPFTTSNFVAVNANGFAYLSRASVLTSSTSLASNSNLYGSSAPNGTLAPWYDDLSVGAVGGNPAGKVLYQTQGAAGSRKLTVQWTNVSSYTNTTGGQPRLINFQLVLSETSNEIEFRYGTVTGPSHSSLESASIGLEDSVGGAFLDAVTGSRSTSNGMMTTAKWPVRFLRFKP